MKILHFIQFMFCIAYVLCVGILWGGYIAGEEIPLFVLISLTIYIIGWAIKTFFEIKE